MQEKIPFNEHMSVLDVGCGAGAYAIALAEKVGSVVGVDFSPKMLAVGRGTIADHQIANIEFKERDWWTCDGGEFQGKYDLVFAHTTPAIADYNSFVKMIEASKAYGVFCKPARRADTVMDAIRKMVGLKDISPDNSVAYAFHTLWALGYNPEITYEKTVWQSCKTLDEAKGWYLNRIKGACDIGGGMEKKICRYLDKISKDGMVEETIHTTLVTIFWEVFK